MRRRTSSSTGPLTILGRLTRNGPTSEVIGEAAESIPNRNSELFRVASVSKSRSFNELDGNNNEQ